jgi:hypothetical protein
MANEDSGTRLTDTPAKILPRRVRRNINRARWINGQLINTESTDKPIQSHSDSEPIKPIITEFASQFGENKSLDPPSPILSPQPDPQIILPNFSLITCPWSQNGRLVGLRYFGPLVRNPLKTSAIRFIDPVEPTNCQPIIAPDSADNRELPTEPASFSLKPENCQPCGELPPESINASATGAGYCVIL